jgi:hypothetical protein
MNKENISELQNLKDKSSSPIKVLEVLDFKTDFIFSILKPSFYKGRCAFLSGNFSSK